MRITVFGSGYVGLVTGACLADVGNHVLCVDVDEAKVAKLKRGELPIFEPGLEDIVRRTLALKHLDFTTDAARAVAHAEIQMIAVGTPPGEDGAADLRHVLDVARTIGRSMENAKAVVSKSTVPVGTGDQVRAAIAEELARRRKDIPFHVVSNPEFLKEGAAVEDFTRPDRIIVGADSDDARDRLTALYAPFNRNHDKLIFMDVRSAELTKYAANAMLATKISFMNEMANLAERVGADIERVRIGIGSDPRIGYHFIYPGCGYGGSCFPKDVKALASSARGAGVEPAILNAVEARNERQKRVLFEKIHHHFDGRLAGRTIALWGLAFKPDTDDLREAPSRTLMEALWDAGALVRAYDPAAMAETRRLYGERPDLKLCATPEQTLDGADALAIVTEWKIFRSPDPDAFKARMKQPLVFDGRNLYDPWMMARAGVEYHCIGRPVVVE